MLLDKTLYRTEIDHLSELLHSRAGEVSLRDDRKRNEETVSDFGRHQQIVRGPVEENRNTGNRSHEVVSTPISNSKVRILCCICKDKHLSYVVIFLVRLRSCLHISNTAKSV